MKKLIALALVAAGLSGCGVPLNKVVSSSERTVVVKAISGDVAQAQKLASAECSKSNLHARLAYNKGVDYVFDCVN